MRYKWWYVCVRYKWWYVCVRYKWWYVSVRYKGGMCVRYKWWYVCEGVEWCVIILSIILCNLIHICVGSAVDSSISRADHHIILYILYYIYYIYYIILYYIIYIYIELIGPHVLYCFTQASQISQAGTQLALCVHIPDTQTSNALYTWMSSL